MRYKPEMVSALCKEIELQKDFAGGEKIETIYFGGGTPSLLSAEECSTLMQKLYKTFDISADAEITLEANPDDITAEKLDMWKGEGVNRLSIGIQSFFEEELRWMNRAHNAGQAEQCIELSLKAGFKNFSIDLIYGSPLLTDEMWQQNVAKAVGYGITHLSCYALTVEEKTPLHKLIDQNKKQSVDADKQARQFMLLMQWLQAAGYQHYEVSNFAKPGYRSRHNSAYWQGKKYVGIGPSAHSYNGQSRFWNVANNQQYIQAINNNTLPNEIEVLTAEQRENEYIMISLRTMEGMDLHKIESDWGQKEKQRVVARLKKYVENNLVQQQDNLIQLTNEGMLMADGIAADLFV